MKRLSIIFSFLTLVSISTYAQREIEAEGFKLKQYYFVMLSAGPNKEKIDSLKSSENTGRASGKYQKNGKRR